jgi:ATP-dependent Clp protease, protease subunit
MKTWYKFQAAAAEGQSQTVSIHDDIGGWGVSAKMFLDELRKVAAPEVNVEINSPGGDVFAGLAIYNGLRNSGKKVNVKVLGIAASAASLVAMAGDTIEMPENTFMMIHNPWTFAAGDAEDLREQADLLDKIGDSLTSTYARRTGKSAEEIQTLLAAETWFTAQEAVDAGFATAVTPAFAAQASFDVGRLPENVRSVFALAKADAGAQAPAPDEAPAPAPTPEALADEAPAPTHADQVQAVAAAYGLQAYAALWALDPSVESLAAVKSRAREAHEIKALCALAEQPDMADGLIRKGATLADARVAIFDALENASTNDHIDTSRPVAHQQPNDANPTAGVTATVWETRRKQLGVTK